MRHFILIVILLFSCHVLASEQKGESPVKSCEKKVKLSKWEAPIKDPNNPDEVMKVKWDAIAKVLSSEKLDQKGKEKEINTIINPIFDFKLMGKLTLGRSHWPKLSKPQSDKFIKLFVVRLKDSYRNKISAYKNEKVTFKPAVKDKKSARILMTIFSEGKKFTILYKFRKVEKGWKIYDMEIEGVSVILTYRSQFNDILSHGSVENFLRQLEKKPVS